MRKTLIVGVLLATALLVLGACAPVRTPAPTPAPTEGIPEPTPGAITHLKFKFATRENWDADAEVDGLVVRFQPRDKDEIPVTAPGTTSAELWETNSLGEKKQLLQKWQGIQVTKEDYDSDGAKVRLEYNFQPKAHQYAVLVVTFTTQEGNSFSDESCTLMGLE